MEKRTHIMIVDDEPYVTQLVERILREAGYLVTVANDSNSAHAIFKEKEPDLVLLDIKMPGLDGYQVLECIRDSSEVPVIMLTALREKPALAHSFNLGADDYIEKPFLSKVLVARIQAKLRRVRGELRRKIDAANQNNNQIL